jgi:hypothetical protein
MTDLWGLDKANESRSRHSLPADDPALHLWPRAATRRFRQDWISASPFFDDSGVLPL